MRTTAILLAHVISLVNTAVVHPSWRRDVTEIYSRPPVIHGGGDVISSVVPESLQPSTGVYGSTTGAAILNSSRDGGDVLSPATSPPDADSLRTNSAHSERFLSSTLPSSPEDSSERDTEESVTSARPPSSEDGSTSHQEKGWDLLRGGRFSQFEASIEAALSGVRSSSCARDTRIFLRDLRNLTLWAAQMFDASVKYPFGVLSGNVYNMGDFDECLSVRGPSDIDGRYCLAKVDILEPPSAKVVRRRENNETSDIYSIWLDPLTSMWEQIEYKGDRTKHRKDSAYWAMCVPSSCSFEDVEMAMNQVLPPLAEGNGIDLKVNVHPDFCTTRASERFSVGEWLFCAVVLLIVSLAISATFFDVYWRNRVHRNSTLGALYLCFSMRKNFKSLPKVGPNNDGLRIMFGIRVLSMIMIIMCHKYGVTIGGATTNGQYIEEGNREVPYMLTLHGDLVVDTFFTVGAFLLAYSGLKDCENKKPNNIAVMYFIRYIRLTPAYALIMFFYATVLNRLGSGPLWTATVTQEAVFCRKNWWTNLLYVSNYVNTEEMCMVQSWYLPCDMHYFLIGASILTLLRQRPMVGHVALGIFAAASISVPFAVTLAGSHDATLLFFKDFLSNPRASRYFHALYIGTHTRAGPYVAGFLAGYLYYRYRLFETKMSKVTAYWMFLMSLIISGTIMFSCIVFYNPTNPYSALEAASYAGLQRFSWGVAVSLLICSVASGHMGFISAILCWTPFIALGKLTYCAYLIHFIYQLIGLGGDRNSNYVTNYNVFLKSTGESVFTFVMALVLYLMVEAPFRDLGRALIGARRPRKAIEENGAKMANGAE